MAETTTNRCRFRPRFTLAALLILVTVISPPLAYVAQRRAWNLKRKAAYERLIKNFGAKIELDNKAPLRESILGRIEATWREVALENLLPGDVIGIVFPGARSSSRQSALLDSDLELLSMFADTRQVEIFDANEISDAGLKVLKTLPQLDLLHLHDAPKIHGDFLSQWEMGCPIRVLRLHAVTGLQGEMLRPLSQFGNLKVLTLRHFHQLNDEALRSVSLPSQLKVLALENVSLGDKTLSRWLAQVKLQELGLDLRISRKIAPALQAQTDLEKLFIRNAPLEDEDFGFLGKCKSLWKLVLSGLPIQGKFLQDFRNDLPLQYVNLTHTLLTDENAASLLRQTNVQRIDLDFTPISGEFLTARPRWTKLAYLQLTGCELNEAGKEALAQLDPQCSIYVDLPLNWRIKDFQRLPDKRRFPLQMQKPMSKEALANPHNVSNFPTDWAEPRFLACKIDRCPAELMAPVQRLYELARALAGKRWEDLEDE